MSGPFLFAIAAVSLLALTPILLPLLRMQQDDEATRVGRKQREALAAARAAGVLSQEEYDAKSAALPKPVPAATPPARVLAALLVVAMPLAALLIYREIGEPRALDPQALTARGDTAAATPDLASAISSLEQRLADTPDDAEGLRLLARGYQSMQRFAEARDTLAKVRELLPQDLDAQVEYAEALALAGASRRVEGEAQALIDDALSRNPDHERALWLAGISAVQREDKLQALIHWQRLLRLLPPDSEVHASVSQQIRELGAEPAPAPAVADVAAGAVPAPAATAGTSSAVQVHVTVASALAARVTATDTVYVFARAAEGPKMPIAIQRFAASELPKTISLDDSMGMMPTLKLSQQERIVIGARISKSGNATPQSGDFEVLSQPLDRAAITAPVQLEITRVVP